MTIIISSHILEELAKISTDYGIIHEGRLLEEITQEELMERCSERIELTLEDPKAALPVLDKMGIIKYQMMDQNHLFVFERLDESALLNEQLVRAGVLVRELKITNEKLETYFLGLTGGVSHA